MPCKIHNQYNVIITVTLTDLSKANIALGGPGLFPVSPG